MQIHDNLCSCSLKQNFLKTSIRPENTSIILLKRNSDFISNVSHVSLALNSLGVTLSHECRCGARLVLPVWWQDSLDLVVAGEAVDTRFDQNQTEFAVNVLTVTFQMLADADGTLDKEVKIFRNVGLQADGFHDAEHFVSVDETHLSDSVGITKNNT